MQSAKLTKAKPGPSTVRYLDIAEIRDDVVVLKDGTMRAVLNVTSINFALKSEEEQEAIIGAYVSFLNNLDHPLQVVIQSRKLNIDKYLHELKEREKTQTNELLRLQIVDYRSFIDEFISLGEIMNKQFYLVVPFDPLTAKKKGFFTRLREIITPGVVIKLREKQFLERKDQLVARVARVVSGLGSMGLQATMLDTQTLIELYYAVYNPQVSQIQKLTDINKLQVET